MPPSNATTEFLSHLNTRRLTEELAAVQKKLKEYETLYYPSHLRAQTVTEQLSVAQKKLKEYEDLIAKLCHNACEDCKGCFRRIPVSGPQTVSNNKFSSTARSVARSYSDCNGSPHPSGSLACRIEDFSGFSSRRASGAPSRVEEKKKHDNRGKILTPFHSRYFVNSIVGTPTLQVKLERVWTHRSPIESVKFSPDGKYLAVGVAPGFRESQKTYIYEVTNRRRICLLSDRYAESYPTSMAHLSFSPGNGGYLSTGHSTGQAMIWQVGKKHVRNSFGNAVNAVDFSPDGRFFASSSYRAGVHIWSMRDGSSILLGSPDDRSLGSGAVKFSPDGKHVLASDVDGMIRLWNVRSSKLVRKWRAHQDTVWGVAFMPNGRGLVTASHDRTLKYWDLGPPVFGDLREVRDVKFVGHTKGIRSAAISSDGRWLVSGSDDRTARIWDIVDASQQCALLGHEQGVTSVDFCPTDNYVACGSRDGKVSVWRYESSRD